MPDSVAIDTLAGWQRYFDKNFPDGLLATQIRYSEGSARADDSPQMLMSQIRVIEVEDDGASPTLSLVWAGMDRDSIITIERLEERPEGCLVITAEQEVPDFLFSRNMTDAQRQAVRREREAG